MRKNIVLFMFVSALLLLSMVSVSMAADGTPPVVIEKEIVLRLENAYSSYTSGDKEAALALARDAYFVRFEGEGLETSIEAWSPSRMAEVESLFVTVIDEMDAGKSPATVRATIDELKGKLSFAVAALEKKRGNGAISSIINSLIVILREGLEAILIISALSTYLVKIGKKEQVRIIYLGALIALAASLVIALLFYIFLPAGTRSSPTFEGVTLLFATVILFYVSYWLVSKVQVVKWQKFIRSRVEGALGSNNVYTLGFAAFLAVFREGAETVLFYQALSSSSGGGSSYILLGFGMGVLILTGIFFAFRYGTIKIPLAPFFAITSTLLYYIAFTFVGKGILELQEARWIPITPVKWIPSIGFIGLYPSWEGVSIQLLLIFAMVVAVVYSFLVKPYLEREKRLKEIAHVASDISGLHDTLEHITHHAILCQELSNVREGEEVEEIRGHLREIDSKAHEVMDHLSKLESALSDVFEDMEKTLKKKS